MNRQRKTAITPFFISIWCLRISTKSITNDSKGCATFHCSRSHLARLKGGKDVGRRKGFHMMQKEENLLSSWCLIFDVLYATKIVIRDFVAARRTWWCDWTTRLIVRWETWRQSDVLDWERKISESLFMWFWKMRMEKFYSHLSVH